MDNYSEDQLLRLTKKLIQQKTSQTRIFENDADGNLTRVEKSELTVGRVLGRGGFCVVSQVVDGLTPKDAGSPRSGGRHMRKQGVAIDRGLYVIKQVSQEAASRGVETYVNSIVDLAMEAKWLAAVQHPNIISIRGVSSEAPHGRNFFIVLDQLHDILTTRLQTWKKQKPNGLKKMFHSGREKERDTWLERMKAAYGIASALEYLHSKNVMHRDLKPDDIGFNAKGDVTLFDFGLAKEFDPLKADKNGCYNMTPFTGSMRFMAPEVALARPCNETTDVYSYGLLLYQILALEPPFYGLTVKSFPKLVHEKGARPVVDPKWPVELSSLMKRCWSPTIRDRPSMTEVANTVSKEICLE